MEQEIMSTITEHRKMARDVEATSGSHGSSAAAVSAKKMVDVFLDKIKAIISNNRPDMSVRMDNVIEKVRLKNYYGEINLFSFRLPCYCYLN
jgi:hypothetical protein